MSGQIGPTIVPYEVEDRSGLAGSTVYAPKSLARAGYSPAARQEGGFADWSQAGLALAYACFVALPWSYSQGGSPWRCGDIHEVPLETEQALAWLKQRRPATGPPMRRIG